MAISIITRKKDEKEILGISGKIISTDSEKLKRKLDKFCTGSQKKVIIDLTNVTFIDSFGLGAIVGHYTDLKNQGRELVILNKNPDSNGYIRRLFEMTSLDTIFKIADSEQNL